MRMSDVITHTNLIDARIVYARMRKYSRVKSTLKKENASKWIVKKGLIVSSYCRSLPCPKICSSLKSTIY